MITSITAKPSPAIGQGPVSVAQAHLETAQHELLAPNRMLDSYTTPEHMQAAVEHATKAIDVLKPLAQQGGVGSLGLQTAIDAAIEGNTALQKNIDFLVNGVDIPATPHYIASNVAEATQKYARAEQALFEEG